MKEFTVFIEQDEEGWYVSEVAELPGCHTQARSIDELLKRTKEAISLYLESERPSLSGKFIGLQKVQV